MKYKKPQIVFQGGNLALIQAGVKDWVFILDLIWLASSGAYEADE